MTDFRDIAVLLLAYPEAKSNEGLVSALLSDEARFIPAEWQDWITREILPKEDDF